jgi:AcrR family transcriptional regulator
MYLVVLEPGAMAVTAPRRTQAERRASTQTRLLDATLECVAELGYHRTTTTEVARRAGLSRGAQLHHFGTKAELVVRALDHLHERYNTEFRAAMAELAGSGANPLEAAIDVLWGLYSTPTGSAWMALSLAAAGDPELRSRMAELDRRSMAMAAATFAELFPGVAGVDPLFSIAPLFTFTVLDGLALRYAVVQDDQQVSAVLDALKAVSRVMAPAD